MDDFTFESFADVPSRVDKAAWSILNVMGEMTLQHYLLGILALFLLFCLLRHKQIMAEVRGSFLRVHTLILGGIYAIMAIGIFKIF